MTARSDRWAAREAGVRRAKVTLVRDALLAAAKLRESCDDTAERIIAALYDFEDEETEPAIMWESDSGDMDTLLEVVRENLVVLREHGLPDDVIEGRARVLVEALECSFLIEERPTQGES